MKTANAQKVDDGWITDADRQIHAQWPKGETEIYLLIDRETCQSLAEGIVPEHVQHAATRLILPLAEWLKR